MGVVEQIIGVLTELVAGFWTIVASSITSAVGIFYDSVTGLTTIGVLGLFGLGVGLVSFGLMTAMSFFKKS